MSNVVHGTAREMDRAIVHLIECGLCEDQNFASVKSFPGDKRDVTFSGGVGFSVTLKNVAYSEAYSEIVASRAYNAKLLDGAILQMSYRYVGNSILQHRLAYLPSPSLEPFKEVAEGYLEDKLYVEISSRNPIPVPIRFDYDEREGVAVPVRHPKSHMTFGQIMNCRIPVSAALSPMQFVDFILRSFYQVDGYDFLSSMPRGTSVYSECLDPEERRLIHVTVPR